MTNLAIFFLLTLVGGLIVWGGIKANGIAKIVLIVVGALLLIPGVYGLFTALL